MNGYMTKIKQQTKEFHGLKTRGKFQELTVEFEDTSEDFDEEYIDIPVQYGSTGCRVFKWGV